MAPTFLSKTEYRYIVAPASNWQYTHTIENVSVSALIVSVHISCNDYTTTVDSVTYGGIPMTKICEATPVGDDGSCATPIRTAMFILVSPPVGSATISITSSVNCLYLMTVAKNYTGSDRDHPIRNFQTAFSASDYCSGTALQIMLISVASSVNDLVIGSVGFYGGGADPSYTIGANETQRHLMVRSPGTAEPPKLLVLEKAGASNTVVTLSDTIQTPDPRDYSWSFCAVSLAFDPVNDISRNRTVSAW